MKTKNLKNVNASISTCKGLVSLERYRGTLSVSTDMKRVVFEQCVPEVRGMRNQRLARVGRSTLHLNRKERNYRFVIVVDEGQLTSEVVNGVVNRLIEEAQV